MRVTYEGVHGKLQRERLLEPYGLSVGTRRYLVARDRSGRGRMQHFRAAGHLEVAWHLYQWGDKVEVVAPDALRALVAGHRRSDFPALP